MAAPWPPATRITRLGGSRAGPGSATQRDGPATGERESPAKKPEPAARSAVIARARKRIRPPKLPSRSRERTGPAASACRFTTRLLASWFRGRRAAPQYLWPGHQFSRLRLARARRPVVARLWPKGGRLWPKGLLRATGLLRAPQAGLGAQQRIVTPAHPPSLTCA